MAFSLIRQAFDRIVAIEAKTTQTAYALNTVSALGVSQTDLVFTTQDHATLSPNTNRTLTSAVPPAATRCTLILTQTTTTSRTMTFGSGFLNSSTLATGTVAGVKWIIQFISDGTSLIEVSRVGPV